MVAFGYVPHGNNAFGSHRLRRAYGVARSRRLRAEAVAFGYLPHGNNECGSRRLRRAYGGARSRRLRAEAVAFGYLPHGNNECGSHRLRRAYGVARSRMLRAEAVAFGYLPHGNNDTAAAGCGEPAVLRVACGAAQYGCPPTCHRSGLPSSATLRLAAVITGPVRDRPPGGRAREARRSRPSGVSQSIEPRVPCESPDTRVPVASQRPRSGVTLWRGRAIG